MTLTSEMRAGLTRIGHVTSSEEDELVVSATFDEHGVEVVWPRTLRFSEAFERSETLTTPTWLIFRDDSGYLTLREGSSSGLSMSTVGSSKQRIRFLSALETGAEGADYTTVNGMASEIDGLARWARITTVETKLHFQEGKGVTGLTLSAENKPDRVLGGAFDVRLKTSYSHKPTPVDGVFSLTDRLQVQTQTAKATSWADHASQHRIMQDLMCLVYGAPCVARLTSVMREDDQPYGTEDDRRWWPKAYEPTFGRARSDYQSLAEDRQPLFFLEEADEDRVEAWLTDFLWWARPTGIAVTTIFQRGSTAEAQLLQVGIALEALGYAIWLKSKPAGGKTPTYPQLLAHVTEAVGVEDELIYGPNSNARDWRVAFNQAFKGAKHADNPLPVAIEAAQRARQGFMLLRCWLARELGVDRELLAERLRRVRDGSWR